MKTWFWAVINKKTKCYEADDNGRVSIFTTRALAREYANLRNVLTYPDKADEVIVIKKDS